MNRFSRAAAGFLVFTVLSSASAWFNIQAVRWSYQNRRLRLRLEDLQTEQAALQRERADVRKQLESILKMVEGLE